MSIYRLKLIAVITITVSLILCQFSQAQTTTSIASGDWNDASTWDTGTVPTSGDVVIATGHNVIFNGNHPTLNVLTITSLDIQGTGSMIWPFSDDNEYDATFRLNVTGSVTVALSASITTLEGGSGSLAGSPADRTFDFRMEGGLDNDGSIDLTGTTDDRVVNVDFQANTQTVSGDGSFNFYGIDILGTSTTTTTFSDIDATVEDYISLQETATLEINGESTINIGEGVVDALRFESDGTTFLVSDSDATVNINVINTSTNAVLVDANNCSFKVTGGTVNIGVAATGEGRFRINNSAKNFNMDISSTSGVVNIADNISYNYFSSTPPVSRNFSVTNGGTLNVGTSNGGQEDITTIHTGSTFNIDGSTVNFGENVVFDVAPTFASGAVLSVGTNSDLDDKLVIGTNWTLDEGSTLNAEDGIEISAGSEFLVMEASTLEVEGVRTSYENANFQVYGTLSIEDGTVNVGAQVTGDIERDGIQIQNAGIIDLQKGTINIFNNPALTSTDAFTDGGGGINGGIEFRGVSGTLNIGSAGTATVNIATNLVAQYPPTEIDLFVNSAEDGLTNIYDDGELNVGGGNIGSVLLDDDLTASSTAVHFSVQGGTVNIAGGLDMHHGAGFEQSGGTVNIGITESNGTNKIDFGSVSNAQAPTIFKITGGEMNVGDGSIVTYIGNGNGTPAHGSTSEYIEMNLTGGTLNFNGAIHFDDANARLILGNSDPTLSMTLNFDPQYTGTLEPTEDILQIERGIVDIQGLTNINFLNPLAISDAGYALTISEYDGSSVDRITSSYSSLFAPVDFSKITWKFGDGVENNYGGDGFDLELGAGHTSYGNFEINNPVESGREVIFTTTGVSYPTEDITITAGTLDIGTNNLYNNGTGTILLIDANGTLKLDSDFPGTFTTAKYDTYTLNSGSTVEYNGTATVANAEVPDGTAFSNLIISGTGTKTLNSTSSVDQTLTLTTGTLAAGNNLTMGSGSTISRSGGTVTGDIQGDNNYTIEYTGLSKTIDSSIDPEWSGGGTFNLTINMEEDELLTLTNTSVTVNDLVVTQGILTDDDSALSHDVIGDITMNTSYTGLGTINITEGSSDHVLATSGTATFSNLTMDDSHNAVGDIAMVITGELTLTEGKIVLGEGSMTLNSGATIDEGSADSYVAFSGRSTANGMTQTFQSSTESRTFPLGTSTKYTPGTIGIENASSYGALTIIPVDDSVTFTLSALNSLDLTYHWMVIEEDPFVGSTYNHTYTYDDADLRGPTAPNSYISAGYNISATTWIDSDNTGNSDDGVNIGNNNTITLKEISFLGGLFTAGDQDEFTGIITTLYPRTDLAEPLDWADPSSWTKDQNGNLPINRIPGANTPVELNRTVRISTDGQRAGSIHIEASDTLIIDVDADGPTNLHVFTYISGTGTLKIISNDNQAPVFPDQLSSLWNDFLKGTTTEGGTVVYGGAGSYTLPYDVESYYNLVVTGTGASAKTLRADNLYIYNNLSVTGDKSVVLNLDDTAEDVIAFTVDGNVTIESTNTMSFGSTQDRDLKVKGDIINNGTFNISTSGSDTAYHHLTISGSLVSDGVTDMNKYGSVVDVTFDGTSNETISGDGSVEFNRLIVDKGTSQSAILEATVATMTITDTGTHSDSTAIHLKNGTLKLSTTGDFTVNTLGSWKIPTTAKLHINNSGANVIMTSTASTFNLFGSIQITDGTMTIGDQAGSSTINSIRYEGTAAEIIVDGANGILNVGGAIRPNVTDATAALNFTQSNGIVSLARNTVTNNISVTHDGNNANADFALDNALCAFNMSGGILEIIRPKAADGKIISISKRVTDYSVTGGTVRLMSDSHDGITNITKATTDIAIYSNVPFWNLELGDGDYAGDIGHANVHLIKTFGGPLTELTILNDLTINMDNSGSGSGSLNMFRADNLTTSITSELNINIGGSLTITKGTVKVMDSGEGGTFSFIGSGLAGQTSPQVINSNGQTLGDIVINNTNGSGSVQLGADLTISGDWTHTAGSFDQNGNVVTMTTNAGSNGTTINGDVAFDHIVLDNSDGISLLNADMTINSGGSLALGTDVLFDIGNNGLTIEEESSGAISTTGTFSNTTMIRTSGTTTAKGITRAYPATITSGFVFPIGTNVSGTDYYTPAQIDITTDDGTGNITVAPIAKQHHLVQPLFNTLNYYWHVTDDFTGSPEATHTYTYGTENLVEGGEDSGFVGSYYLGSPDFTWDTSNQNATVDEILVLSGKGEIVFTSPGSSGNVISGDFTAGDSRAFSDVTVFYTMRDGDWDNITSTTTPWSLEACGETQTETLQQPEAGHPVIVCSGHTLTITSTTDLAAAAVEISGTLISEVADISTIGGIDGTGTLQFSQTTNTTPVYGTLSSTFIDVSGGTVDFGGSGSYTLPDNSAYNNLIISNTGTVTLANNITINGDATFNGNGGVVELGGNTISDPDEDGIFTLGNGTILEVDDLSNFPDNFNTYALDSESTVDYTFDDSGFQHIKGDIIYGNLSVTRATGTTGSPVKKMLYGNITVMGDLQINDRVELLANNKDITLHGNWTIDAQNTGNFVPDYGTVTFAGSSNQEFDFANGTNSETFYDLVINQTGGGTNLTFGSNVTGVTVTNDLTITDESLDMGVIPLAVEGNFATSADGIFTSSGTLDIQGNLTNDGSFAVANIVNLAGDFTNEGTYDNTSNTLLFDNTSKVQSLSGDATTFNNITVNKASGVDLTLNSVTTINGTLALQEEGNVVLTENLIIGVNGSITGDAGGTTVDDFSEVRMIRTNGDGGAPYLIKNADDADDWDFVFPTGVEDGGSNKYTPVVVDATNDNINNGTLAVRSVNGTDTDQLISATAETLDRHFDFDITGLTDEVTFDILFKYEDDDVGLTNESEYLSAYSDRNTTLDGWIQPLTDNANTDAGDNLFGASATLTDGATVTFNSGIETEWTAGDRDLIFPHYYSINDGNCTTSCNWSDPTHWTLSDGGTDAAGLIPGSDDEVTISAGHTMLMDNDDNSATQLEVNGTLDFATTTGHSLGDLIGNGKVKIESNKLSNFVDNNPDNSTFFGNDGGTVEYGGVAYTLASTLKQYYNLIITGSGSSDKTLGVDTQDSKKTLILGDLTVNTVDLLSNDYNVELRGSFTSSNSGNLQIANGTFIWSNSSIANLSPNVVFGTSGNLTIDNSGEKKLDGTLNVNNLTINSSSGDLNANSNDINLIGNWSNKANVNVLKSPGTTTFNGTTEQSISGINTFGTTNISNTTESVVVASGTQTFTGLLTLAASSSFDIGSNKIRLQSSNNLGATGTTFNGSSGTVVYARDSNPESQTDNIEVHTLEVDKGSGNILNNDSHNITFTDLIVTSGMYESTTPTMAIPGSLTIGAEGSLVLTGITTIDIGGNFSNAAVTDFSSVNVMNLGGNFTNTGTGIFSAPTTIDTDGASAQQINSDLATTNFTNSGGGDVTLNADMSVSGTLTLTSGNIVSTTTNLLSLGAGAIVSGGSASSHVTTAMLNTIAGAGATTINFPIGDGTNYRPISLDITQTNGTSRTYTGDLMAGAAPALTLPAGITNYSVVRYYDITQAPADGITNGAITITYGDDDGVTDGSDLRIIKSNSASDAYENLGGVGSAVPSGSITSTNSFATFGVFALASENDSNPLPVELIFFNGEMNNQTVTLKWATASEINNDGFIIERSTDGSSFYTIDKVNGNGTTSNRINYEYQDYSPLPGQSYYRLKQIDYDGQFEYSDIVIVSNALFKSFDASVFPNPTNTENISISILSEKLTEPIYVKIYDALGRSYFNDLINSQEVQSTIRLDLKSKELSGLYFVLIKHGDNQVIKKLQLNKKSSTF